MLTVVYQYMQRPVLGQKLGSKSSHRLEGGKVKIHEHDWNKEGEHSNGGKHNAYTCGWLDHLQTR